MKIETFDFDKPIDFFQLEEFPIEDTTIDWYDDISGEFEGKINFDSLEYIFKTGKKIVIDYDKMPEWICKLPTKSEAEISLGDYKIKGVITRRDYKRNRLHIVGDAVYA